MASYSPWKADLIQSFLRSRTRGVSEEQLQLSRRCIESRDPITYERVNFHAILEDNNHDYPLIVVACDLLLKYITNLLSQRLPQNWWSINTKLPQFVHRISNLRGAKEVLKTAGYSMEQHGTLFFPLDKRSAPDRELLSVVAAELLIAKAECENAKQSGLRLHSSKLVQQPASTQNFYPGGHHDVNDLSAQIQQYPNQRPESANVLHSDSPEVPYQVPVQPNNHSQPFLAPHAKEHLLASKHHQHTDPSGSLGFLVNPPLSYSQQSGEAGQGRLHHQREQLLPSDLSHSSNDSPNIDSNLGAHNVELTREQQKQTGQDLFQQPQREQTTGEGQTEDVEEKQQEFSGTGYQSLSHHNPINSSEQAGSDNDTLGPDTDQPSSIPSWKARSQHLLKIMRQGNSDVDCAEVPQGPHTTSFEVHQQPSQSSSFLVKKSNSTDDMRQHHRDVSPPPGLEQRGKNVRFAPDVGERTPINNEAEEHKPPLANDPSDPDQVDMLECKNCKNMVRPGSKCGYCGIPCAKRRTKKVKTLEQPALELESSQIPPSKLTNSVREDLNNLPSALLTDKVALPPSVRNGQQHSSFSPQSQASPTQPSPSAHSKPLGEPFYPPTYHKDRSSHQEPAKSGPSFPDHPQSSGATASPQVYYHPTDFDLDPPEMKRRREAEWFSGCSPEKQQEFLKEKRALGDEIDHLVPLCRRVPLHTPSSSSNYHVSSSKDNPNLSAPHCSIESHSQKRAAEAEWFSRQSPSKQKEHLKEKERMNDNIDHLLPYLKEEMAQVKTGRKIVDEELMASLEEERKRERMKRDGAIFVHHIKICTRHGFAPEEVEIAYKRNKQNPLNYLKEQWLREIERVKLEVRGYKPDGHSVGEPTMNEVRLALIESRGDHQMAVSSCCKNRCAKIHELMSMIHKNVPVSWEEAVDVLTFCNLQVEEAFYELQRRRLRPLYEFIFGDYKAFTKNMPEMDFLKELAMKKTKKEGVEYQAHLRMLMSECKFHSTNKAKLLIQLLEDNSEYPMRYYIDAASNYSTFEDAQRFLNQPCPICIINYPMDDMVVMPGPCGHSMCKDCFRGYFEITIKEKSVKHFNCPECGKPDIGDLGEIKDFYLELFVAMIKEHVNSSYDLCQQKLRDYALSKDPGFVWCSSEECRSGFINERHERFRLDCPTCHKPMCFHCKKPWEPQHEGLSCEQFASWKADNDPEAQKAGLAAHLEENGIECPDCKMRYDLAQGGCMHFKCTQCPCEFCSGCHGRFKNGQACGKFANCNARGLHAHHPRDCLYYLRDFPVADLQKLLTDKGIAFDTEPRQSQIDAQQQQGQREDGAAPPERPAVEEEDIEEEVSGDEEEEELAIGGNQLVAVAANAPVQLKCCVMLQKEVPNGLVDEKCGKDAPKGMAGLCEVHYKEYLVRKINKNHLDPVELYDLNGVKQILNREQMDVPDQEDDESEVDYRRKLIELIDEQLPIGNNGAQ